MLMKSGLGNRLEEAAGGFMTRFEAETVRELPGNIKQMDRVIKLLLGKADKDFTTFLKMLRDSNNQVWAVELEKKAEQFKNEGVCARVCVCMSVCDGMLSLHTVAVTACGTWQICLHTMTPCGFSTFFCFRGNARDCA